VKKQTFIQHRYFTEPIARKMLALIISLIVVSTALFVTGVVIERSGGTALATTSSHQDTPKAPITSQDPDGGHEGSPSSPSQRVPAGQEHVGVADAMVFGLDLENPWFVGAFVLVWLVLIAALVRLGRIAWLALLLVAIVAAVLDGGEVARKVGEANATVATFAVLVAAAHVALAVLALLVLARNARWGAVQSG